MKNFEVIVDESTKKLLIELANKYETASFVNGDPSCVLKRFDDVVDTECAAFVMALFSFGQRAQFLKKVEWIFELSGNCFSMWIKDGKWKGNFPSGQRKYYRFYSYDDVRDIFEVLQKVLLEYGSLGACLKAKFDLLDKNESKVGILAQLVSEVFANCSMVSHTKQSANKRLHMFFRWMVRRDSPVDIGIWNWFLPRDLVIPLDTHVLCQAQKLNLVPEKSGGTAKTALAITAAMRQVWPDDPCKGDFSLFGLGVNG